MKLRQALALGSMLGVLAMSAWASAATIAQFDFDSSPDGGTTFPDISGNGHDAFFNRTVTVQDSNPFGSKDAKDKSILMANNGGSTVTNGTLNDPAKIDLAKTNHLTLAVWVNPTKYPSGKAVARVIQLESKAGGTTNIFLGINGDGKVITRVYAKGAGTGTIVADATAPLNKWTHLAMVYDGSSLNLFVDGNKAASAHAGRSLPKSLSRVTVGSHLSGAMDDVLISDEALSADQLGFKESFTGQGKAATKPAGEGSDKK